MQEMPARAREAVQLVALEPIQIPTAGSAVYDILRGQILSGRLRPGDRLDLRVLEKQLAVSRSPLKDALSRLTGEGLIEIRPRQGTFVAPMTERRLRENFEVRIYLEQGAAASAVSRGSATDIAAIQEAYDDMSALCSAAEGQEQLRAYLEQDHAFHSRIMALTGNTQLTDLYEQVNTHLLIARITSYYTHTDLLVTHREHTEIMAALTARDGAALAHSLGQHAARSIRVALQHLADQREQRPDDDNATERAR